MYFKTRTEIRHKIFELSNNMRIKVHFYQNHLDQILQNVDQEEKFHPDILIMGECY